MLGIWCGGEFPPSHQWNTPQYSQPKAEIATLLLCPEMLQGIHPTLPLPSPALRSQSGMEGDDGPQTPLLPQVRLGCGGCTGQNTRGGSGWLRSPVPGRQQEEVRCGTVDPLWAEAPSPLDMLYRLIKLHVQNTDSRIKLLRISRQQVSLSTAFLSSVTTKPALRLGLTCPPQSHNRHYEEKPFFQSLISQTRTSFLSVCLFFFFCTTKYLVSEVPAIQRQWAFCPLWIPSLELFWFSCLDQGAELTTGQMSGFIGRDGGFVPTWAFLTSCPPQQTGMQFGRREKPATTVC